MMRTRHSECSSRGIAAMLLLSGALLLSSCSTPIRFQDPERQPYLAPMRRAGREKEKRFEELGALVGSPFASLREALDAVAFQRRDDPQRTQGVHVVHREVVGWQAHAFRDPESHWALLDALSVDGLPLAADPERPLCYVVDTFGALGKIEHTDEGYVLWALGVDVDDPRQRWGQSEPALPQPLLSGFLAAEISRRNHAQNVQWKPSLLFRPGPRAEDLIAGLAWIDSHREPSTQVRAIGSRHSWSRVAAVDGITVLPRGCVGIDVVRAARADSGPLVRVLAGTRIREVNAALAELELALPYLGGFDGQTVGGVFATGTHGSVLAGGPLADLIRSVDLATFSGHLLRIEPARASVSTREEVAALVPPRELVLDDELFDAVRVGLGCFGVLHSLTLEAVPRFWLREVRTIRTLDEVRAALAHGGVRACFETSERAWARLRHPDDALPRSAGTPHPALAELLRRHPVPALHFELLLNPYETGKVLLTTRSWIDPEARRCFLAHEPELVSLRSGRTPLVMKSPYVRPGLAELLAATLGPRVVALVEQLARFDPQALPGVIDQSITALENHRGYTNRSYRVFNIGDHTNLLPSLSATISVPLRDDLWLRAIEIIQRVAREQLERERVVQTGPISARFVRGSSALLADAEDTCKFEIIFGGNSEATQKDASKLVRAYYAALVAELGPDVGLHFGQLIPEGTLDRIDAEGRKPLERSARARRWRVLRDQLDPRRRGLTEWLETILPRAGGTR